MKGKPDMFGVWERSVIIGHLLSPKNNYWGIHCFRFYFLEHDVSFHVNLYENKTYGKYEMCNTRASVLFGFAAWLTAESRGLGVWGWSWGRLLLITGFAQFSLTLQGLVTCTTGVKTWCTRLWRDSGCSTPGPGSGPARRLLRLVWSFL